MTTAGPTPAPARAAEGPSLRRRLGTAIAAAGVVLTALLVPAVLALLDLSDRQEAVTELYFQAITEGERSYTGLVDAETAVRGYALTGDPVTLEPYERLIGGDEAEAEGPDLETRLVDELGADHRVMRLRAEAGELALRWYQEWSEPTIAKIESGGTAAVTPAEIERGRVIFEEMRVKVEEYIDALAAERQDAIESLQRATAVLRGVMAAFVVAGIVVGVLLWVFLRRWVTEPLAVLAADARTVADGDVTHPVAGSGPGEVGAVARDVEAMRLRLADLVAEAQAARLALEASHAQVVEQAEDLRRSNRDLEQFAYVASHDLQEPLRKVASFTQLLAKRYEGQLDERADQYIAFAVDGAKRMQRLINDLLGFSRVGRIGGELADVDLTTALATVTRDLEDVIADAGGEVVGQDLPVVRGEEPLLVQLLTNLVGNAVKFRHPDRPPRVRIEAVRRADAWELACHDNGIGIDPQYADRVFVIFQRLHAKDVYEGTGIGLALCKKIVEYHGGDIWIDPEPSDGGTTIRWTLPIEDDPAGPEARSPLPSTETTTKEAGDG